MGGMSLGLMILMRLNITVAILNMVNQTALYMEEHPNRTIDDFLDEGYSLGGDFDWNNEIQQMIMSWYMIAYTLPQVGATSLGMKIGGRFAAPISLLICAISTLLTPMAAYWGWQWVVALRLVNGLGAAAVLPMMIYLIEHWMPFEESSLGLTCAQLIFVIIMALNPFICGYLSAIHWIYAFYIPAAFVLAFCFLWILLITDRPDENPFVSQKELDLICGCSKIKIEDKHNHNHKHQQAGAVNGDGDGKETGRCGDIDENSAGQLGEGSQVTWLDVLKSPTFYSYAFLWVFLCSTINAFFFVLPTYLRQFLKIGVSDNGTYCFIILSGSLLGVLWPHPISRIMETRTGLSVTASRRILYSVVCLMVGGTWIYVGHYHQNQLIAFFINRCFHNGNDIIVMGTIMSNYSKAGLSSLVFSMVNTIGNLSVVFVSPLIGYALDYTGQSVEGWSWLFYTLGLTQLLMMTAYATMIRSEPVQFKRNEPAKSTGFEGSNKVDYCGKKTQQTVVPADKTGNGQLVDKLGAINDKSNNRSAQIGCNKT